MFGAFFWERGWGLPLLTSPLPRAFSLVPLASDLAQLLYLEGSHTVKIPG